MFRNNLIVYRKDQGFTQQEVADALGMSRETYNRLENGRHLPPLEVADKLAEKFGKNIYQLWPCLKSKGNYQNELIRVEQETEERILVPLPQIGDLWIIDPDIDW